MNKLSILVAGLAFTATSGFAATVDFEDAAPLASDPLVFAVGTTYTNGSITFSSTEKMQLVGTGGSPTSGFVPSDSPAGTTPTVLPFGNVFLTGDFDDDTNMTMSFATNLTGISFDIADIDGSGGDLETFVFTAMLGGSVVDTVTKTGPGAVDGEVVEISFADMLFDSVSIVGTTPNGTRNIGWGIDNIETTPVPLPAAGLMLVTALGGMAAMRRRKKSS